MWRINQEKGKDEYLEGYLKWRAGSIVEPKTNNIRAMATEPWNPNCLQGAELLAEEKQRGSLKSEHRGYLVLELNGRQGSRAKDLIRMHTIVTVKHNRNKLEVQQTD